MSNNKDTIILSLRTVEENLAELNQLDNYDSSEQSIICITETGVWVVLKRKNEELISALKTIDLVNELLNATGSIPDIITKKLRIVTNVQELKKCLENINEFIKVNSDQEGDTFHVVRIPNQSCSISVIEQIPTLKYFSGSIIDFILPNFLSELFLADDMATSAIKNGKPEIACCIYGEAYRINPYLVYQEKPTERFEMVALLAGEKTVPYFNMTGGELFESYKDPRYLRKLPQIEQGFEVLVSFKFDREDPGNKQNISVKANIGYDVHRQLLMFGSLMLFRSYDFFLEDRNLDFFVDSSNRLIAIWWNKASRKKRLELDLEAFKKYGISVSGLQGIAPNNPESLTALMGIKNGIPFNIAIQPIIQALKEIDRLDEL